MAVGNIKFVGKFDDRTTTTPAVTGYGWDGFIGNPSVMVSEGRVGSAAAFFNTANGYYLQKTFSWGNMTTVIIGFSSRHVTLGGSVSILDLYNAGTIVAQLFVQSDGSMLLKDASGTTRATSPAGTVGATEAFLEFKYVGGSSGTLELRKNEVVVCTYTGDTRASSGTINSISQFYIGHPGSGGTDSWYLDDLYVSDAYEGNVHWFYRTMTGAGNYTAGVQTGGTGGQPYTAVNENPPDDDTSYLALVNVGDKHSGPIAALPSTVTSIVALAIVARAKSTVTGAQLQLLQRMSGVDGLSTAVTLPTTYANTQAVFLLDPGGATLTPAHVNAMEIGINKAA
jgi:hypothetical protein